MFANWLHETTRKFVYVAISPKTQRVFISKFNLGGMSAKNMRLGRNENIPNAYLNIGIIEIYLKLLYPDSCSLDSWRFKAIFFSTFFALPGSQSKANNCSSDSIVLS